MLILRRSPATPLPLRAYEMDSDVEEKHGGKGPGNRYQGRWKRRGKDETHRNDNGAQRGADQDDCVPNAV